mmetsp:Transcript_16330/g.23823  ORF Transcript_16330/g.23823 Transcript_16330/m.23823 type:complete len:173 (+) Transcript_16330:29-547(+)
MKINYSLQESDLTKYTGCHLQLIFIPAIIFYLFAPFQMSSVPSDATGEDDPDSCLVVWSSCFPFVSGSNDAQKAVTRLAMSITIPMVLKELPVTTYGIINPPSLETALVAACPVDLMSVLKISAVETHVTQLPAISHTLATNARPIDSALPHLSRNTQRRNMDIPPQQYEAA